MTYSTKTENQMENQKGPQSIQKLSPLSIPTLSQAIKSLKSAIDKAKNEIDEDEIILKLTKCEAQIDAAVMNTRWKDEISKPLDYATLTGIELNAFFIEEYQKFNGVIIDNKEWSYCVYLISSCVALGKPMILYGNTGVGKTTIMQSFGRILSILGNPNHPTFITKRAPELVDEFKKGNDINDLYSKPITRGLIKKAGLFIDDIGTEEQGVSYGSKSDVVGDLILAIDARHEMNNRVSYSTNLTGEDLKERYGERVFGRLMKNRTVIIFPESIPDFRLVK